jgi:CcmD family protein
MRYLYAAYAATWIIHLTYIGILGMRYRRLKGEMKDLKARP